MTALCAGALVALSAGPAVAGPLGTESYPPEALWTITDSDVHASATDPIEVAGSNPCKVVDVEAKAKNIFGGTLYSYRVKTTFCYDGTNITSVSPRPPQRIAYANFGWSFQGHLSDGSGGYPDDRSYYTYNTQGKFSCCSIWHAASTYPCITIDLYGSGNWGYGGDAIFC